MIYLVLSPESDEIRCKNRQGLWESIACMKKYNTCYMKLR